MLPFAIAEHPLTECDLIFVLAGRAERQAYGIELFQKHLAPRLILSIARFDVRHSAALLDNPELIALRDRTPANQRHFWADFNNRGKTLSLAHLKRTGTFEELQALANYLAAKPPARIAMISTSIHLGRVEFCCRRIPFFSQRSICFWPVPEERSSFKRAGWWKHRSHWRYVTSEFIKLGGYYLRYR